MRDKTIIPTNLLDWPRVAPRLPEEKLILLALWAANWMKSCGCGMVPLRPFSATLGLSPEATMTGITNLAAAGLLSVDAETLEVVILDWYRFHTFKSVVAGGIARRDIEKIQSSRLKKLILEKSSTCLPTATATQTNAAAGEDDKKVWELHESGIECWSERDHRRARRLADEHPREAIAAAITAVRAAGKSPVPGLVERELAVRVRRAQIKPVQTAPNTAPDPAAQTRGEELLPASLRQKIKKKEGGAA